MSTVGTAADRGFDLQDYLARSGKLELEDLDWASAPRHPVEPGTVRSLQYMMDIESHTLCYLQALLDAGAGADREVADFLACWLYEETFHGKALERFLREAGVPRPKAVCQARSLPFQERFEAVGAKLASLVLPGFAAAHMTWGAIQEHSTLNGYTCLARKTRHPLLAELLRRLAHQESRHFSFYYHKAAQLLGSRAAQRTTSALLRAFWTPVGEGVKPRSETDFLLTYIFDGPEGREALARIDKTAARLPGLGWFDLMTRRVDAAHRRQAQWTR